MTVHRPHPIAGPWPYVRRTTATHAQARQDRRDGVVVPLGEREPLSDSLIYDDPDDAVLYDACDRCAQHAADPLASLDQRNLAALYRLMLDVERDPIPGHYRTGAEADACRTLYRLAVFVERTQPHLDPWQWPWALRARARA